MSLLKLRDGRALDYITNESENTSAILFHHGTPGECTGWQTWFDEIDGVKAIAASRPGYGLSDRNKGRTVARDLDDLSELLEFLKVKSFVSVGWSGGGPHAINFDLFILAFHEFEGVLLNPTITGQPFKVMSHQECAKESGAGRARTYDDRIMSPGL